MVLKSPFNLTSVMACRGDPPPPKLQAPCIMCGLRVFFDRLLPGCHTISPERIPRETCRGTKQTRFSTVQPRFILCSRRSQDIHSHMAPASQPPTPQLSPNPPSIRSGRAASQLRPITLTPDYVATAEGSVLISIGHTRVLCNATVEQGVPAWLRNSGRGWVAAD